MRGAVARRLRRETFGSQSRRFRQYQRGGKHATVLMNAPLSPRTTYKRMKRAHRERRNVP